MEVESWAQLLLQLGKKVIVIYGRKKRNNWIIWYHFRYHMATCAANQESFDETRIKQGSIFAWTYHFMCFIGEWVTFDDARTLFSEWNVNMLHILNFEKVLKFVMWMKITEAAWNIWSKFKTTHYRDIIIEYFQV